jgi:hypothetical protein
MMHELWRLVELGVEETKVGGWLAAGLGIAVGVFLYAVNPFIVDAQPCIGDVCTGKALDFGALLAVVVGAVCGGGLGAVIAGIAVDRGVSKSKLGIDEDETTL